MNQIIKFNGVDRKAWLETVSRYQNIEMASSGDIAFIAYEGSEVRECRGIVRTITEKYPFNFDS